MSQHLPAGGCVPYLVERMIDTPSLQFLRYCLDDSKPLPSTSNNIDWKKMLTWAESQTIVGIVYQGIQRVGKEISMPFETLMQWVGNITQIEQQNRLVNDRNLRIINKLKEAGFQCCVLKGQGNSVMYPYPLWRTPGDIDLWIRGQSVREIIKYVRIKNPGGKAQYLDVQYGDYEGVSVEVHYRPTFLNNLILNRRVQKWIKSYESEQFFHPVALPEGIGHVNVPTWEFNIVFQLSHIYRHVIQSGIGLRQIIDYYYLLKSEERKENSDILDALRTLGLIEIAGAVMWVLNEVLGLSAKYLIAPKDEKRGKVLLEEIMKGGNFGHYDVENQKANNAIKRNLQRIKRDMRMMRYFPSECLWEPVFRVYHYFWRMKYNEII